ncbi:MAG: hypothetical protein QOE00_2079 [Ilumatobacteraceae bacterium]|jgi:hypothetical protein
MDDERRLDDLEAKVGQLVRERKRLAWRSRWAAVGAAVAVTLGGGTVLHYALAAPGDVVTGSFVPITPTRILDTRPAPQNVGGFVGPLGTGGLLTFQVTGVAGVPGNATAVVMNVTVDKPSGSSFLTVFPAGAARPTASNLNWSAGTTIPNLVTVKIGVGGQVSIFNLNANVQVIADVAGYYVPSNDKFISLDIFANDTGSAAWAVGRNELAGLRFSDGVNNSASFHFVMPPDYTPGTTIVGSFTWHAAAVSCGVAWKANYVSASRTGMLHVVGINSATGLSDPGPTTSSATSNLVQTATFTINSPNASFTFQPGDSYTFGIFREGAAAADTCTGYASIDSMVIRYE